MKWLLSFFLYFTSLLVFFICISIYLMLICFVSPYKIQPIAHLLCRLILLSSGQWLVIEGDWPPIDRVRLYLSNHESILDAFIFGAALSGQVSAVAAEDYFSIPIWGTIMRRYGVIPIKRKIHDQAMASMELAEQAVKAGTSIIMCPEGTRTSDGQIGEFKKGAFYLALKARPVIVPLAIVGAYEARNRKSWLIRPSIIRLRIGQPLMPEQYEDIGPANLADFIREKVISLT